MPVMDGYEATKKIRKLEKGKEVLIVAISGHQTKSFKQKCFTVGMDDFLSKPATMK